MKINVESISPIKKKLSISIPETEFSAEIDEVYRKVGNSARIPGFRPGKVPRQILEKKFGPSVEQEAIENMVRKTMLEALQNHELEPVAMPEIKDPKRAKGEGFSYTANIEVKPQFEPKDYKGIELKQSKNEVTAEQIQEVFSRLQNEQSVLKDREGATTPVKGDHVALTIQGIDQDGNPVSKDEPREQIYEIGGEILHADVEKAVKKMKIGDVSPVTVTAEVTKEGDKKEKKEIHVRVGLKSIKEKILPALNDDFAKSVGPFENLAALRTRITEDLQKEVEEKGKAEMVQKVLEVVLKKNPIDLPHALIDREVHSMIQNVWEQLERAGIQQVPAEYSEDALHKKFHPDAERRVHEQLMIEGIAKKENLSVDENEVQQRLIDLAGASKVPLGEFRSYYEKTGRLETLRFHMLAKKTLDLLLSNAKIK